MSEGNVSSQLKKNWFLRHKIVSGVLLLFVIIVVAAACSGPSELTEQTQTQAVFDVPSLMGKNLDEVIAIMGKPNKFDTEPTVEQLSGAKEWDKTYEKEGYELLVTYDVKTRNIVDYFISAKSDSEMSKKDMEKLLEVINAKQNDPQYLVEFVKTLKDPSIFTGVKIVPKK